MDALYQTSIRPWLVPAVLIVVAAALLVLLTQESITLLIHDWSAREEYSHGMLIPFLSIYLLYQQRAYLKQPTSGQHYGLIGLGLGALVVLAGSFSTIHALTQYGVVISLIALFYTFYGTASWRHTILPLLLLLFMVPLPHFLHQAASAQLQLWSSQIGVWLIELMGISVYLEGNVIDLGVYKLQVLEACDGLRYLFPLLTLSAIVAYLYRGSRWQKIVLFLSAVPLTVGMNSLRIAMIGWMVDRWGTSMAEGFLHDFQGWSMFLVCVALLVLEARVLARWRDKSTSLLDLFALDGPQQPVTTRSSLKDLHAEAYSHHAVTWQAPLAASFILGACLLLSLVSADRQNTAPTLTRRDFLEFPLELSGEWQGRRDVLETIYINELKLDDYLLANYQNPVGEVANLYIAFYADQKQGASVHSPKTCLPGGGWLVESFETIRLDARSGGSYPVNRTVIAKGSSKQLVYYWFEQRGQVIANEYAVKWRLLVDSIRHGRSDGALVRIVMPIPSGSTPRQQDRVLEQLAASVRAELEAFIPG